jgi:hypothetical protein
MKIEKDSMWLGLASVDGIVLAQLSWAGKPGLMAHPREQGSVPEWRRSTESSSLSVRGWWGRGKGQGATPLHGELTWGQRGGWGSLKKGLHSDSGRVEVHARGGRRRG